MLPDLVAILGLIALASIVAPRVSLPAPVLLALTGIGWALIPGLAPPVIDPHIVLSVFLPPLLYADAWRASWRDFRRWLRPILSLAIGLVAFTILCVGVAAHWLMPELPWAACFLLGAIVSPTDTVAVHSVLSRLRLPRRVMAIIGGESLINDATGLLGVQLALTAILTGVFETGAIATEFARIAGLGLVPGYWDYQNRVNMGSLTFTTITWKTAFSKMDSTYFSQSFSEMRNYRDDVSAQLGAEHGTSYVDSTGFYDGFGNNHQDVLIGSFFAAYTGKGSGNKFFDVFSAIPLPNWDIRYNGLSKFEFLKDRVKNFTISHAYRSTVSVSNYQTNLNAFDENGNQNRDASNNYIPGRQIQSVTITEQFAPLIGLDATWTVGKNGLITKLEFTKDRSLALNIPNLQVMEMRGREIVIGSGYKFTKVKLPIKFMGKTPESDLNIRFDLNIRNNLSIARNVLEDTNQPTAGTRTYSLKFRVDYNLGPNLNAAVYFDRVVNKPVLSNAYPTANTSAGLSLRFNLAQ